MRITALGQEGEVLAVADGMADISLGALKTRQPLDALERLGRAKSQKQERVTFKPAMSESVNIELDLRGHRASEIGEMLERYLDSAHRGGLPWVRVIHGKGTGALRNVVRDYLSQHPAVMRHELAPQEQGGDGATLVTLRES